MAARPGRAKTTDSGGQLLIGAPRSSSPRDGFTVAVIETYEVERSSRAPGRNLNGGVLVPRPARAGRAPIADPD